MDEQTLQVTFLAPIPVGHRVRLCFYRPAPPRSPGGWMDRMFADEARALNRLILIEDLQTGITYSPAVLWERRRGQGARGDEQLLYLPELSASFILERELSGRIRGCRVLTRSGNAANHRMITILTVQTG